MGLSALFYIVDGLAIPAISGWAVLVIGAHPHDFRLARWLFVLAGVGLALIAVVWDMTSTQTIFVRWAVTGLIGAIAAVGTSEALRYLAIREKWVADHAAPRPRGALTQTTTVTTGTPPDPPVKPPPMGFPAPALAPSASGPTAQAPPRPHGPVVPDSVRPSRGKAAKAHDPRKPAQASPPPTINAPGNQGVVIGGNMTGGTINQGGKPNRSLNAAFQSELTARIPKAKQVVVGCDWGDAEAYRYATAIWEFLASRGYNVGNGITQYSVPADGPLIVSWGENAP